MAIYQVGNEQFEIDDAISPEQAIQSINSIIAGRDNAFQFSWDAAREMTGGGLETLGNLSEKYLGGDLGVSEYGEDLRKRAAEDIKEGGYVPKYQGDFLDQRSLGDAVGYIGEGIAQNAFSGGAAIAGGGATALAGLFSAPAAIVLGGATLVGSAVLGTGETANEMRDKTGQVNEELAAGAGLLIGFLDKFGAGKLFSKSELVDMTMGQLVDQLQKKGYRRAAEELTKETLKRAGAEGLTEATQELAVVGATAATGGEYTPGEVVNRAINAGVIGTGQGGIVAGATQAVTMGVTGTQSTKHLSKLDTEAELLREIGMETDNPDVLAAANQLNIAVEQARNGDLTLLKEIADAEQNADQVPVDESNRKERAQASFASRLQTIAEDGDALTGNPLNLQDVDPASESGARKAVETAHGQIAGQITELIAILKGRLDPKQAETLDELFDRADVKQSLKFSRNKVKKSFPNSVFEKLGELTAGTREGDLLRNLVLESMELTRVHNEGYVGGLSGFVDKYINPFSNAGSYNSKAQMANALRFVGSAVAGTASGGLTFLGQLGLIGGSRAIDALTGGRSAVGTYVNQNIDNTRLGVDPSLPSLFEQQKSLQATQREQDMLIQALTANLNLTPAAGPEFAILKTVQDAVQVYEGETVELGPQDIEAANEDLLKTLGEQYRPFYNLIKNRTVEDQLPRELMKVVTDLILSKKRSEIRANRQSENISDAAELRGVINDQREAGKRDNIAFVQELRNQLNEDSKVSAVVKGRVLTVLDEFGRNLGTEPVKSIDQAIKKITSGKTPVPQEVVSKYLNPYRERVLRQQEQNKNAETIATNLDRGPNPKNNEVYDPDTNMLVDNTPFDPADLGDEVNATILPIYPDDNIVPPVKVKTKVEGIRWLFENLYVKHYGTTDPIEYSPENVVIVARKMAAEAMKALEQDNNAIGWYDKTLDQAMRVMSLIDPSLGPKANDPANLLAFKFALAVTSNGTAVVPNFQYAYQAYTTWKDTGKMPNKWSKGGDRNAAMVNAFKFYNTYNEFYEAGDIDMPITEFFNRTMTRGELSKFIKDFNDRFNTNITDQTKDSVDTIVNGSYVLGPKIGQGFYQNLIGNYDNLTADMWWMRMWNRMIGRPFEPEKSEKDMTKNRNIIVREMKSSKGNDRKLVNEALKNINETRDGLYNNAERIDTLTNELHRVWNRYYARHQKETGKNPEKGQLWKTVGTHFGNLGDTVRDQPGKTSDRKFMREAAFEAKRLLKTAGIDITIADFQALMWFPEKRLLRMLGVKPGQGDDNDYRDAAIILAKKEGFTNDQIEETLRETVRGRAGNDNIPSAEGPATGVLQGSGSTSAQGEFNFNEPILSQATDETVGPPADVIIPTPHEVKDEAELATALFEVGKKGSPYEFGVDNAADIARLIEAFNIVLRTYTSQSKMFKESGPGGPGTYGRYMGGGILGAEGKPSIQVMEAGFPRRKTNQLGYKRTSQTETGFLTTMLHELGHHLEGTDRQGRSGIPYYMTRITRRPYDGKYKIADDSIQRGSFTKLLTDIVNAAYYDNAKDVNDYDVVGQVSKDRAKKIAAELDNLQENTEFFFQNRPELSPEFVREDANPERRAKKSEAIYDDLFNKASEADRERFITRETFLRRDAESNKQFRAQYIRSPAETGTDPLWVYIGNPQLAKEVMPETTKLIREFLNDSPLTKGILTFYSSPIATAVAAALGLLAVNGPGGEEEEISMPMSGTPATGMLTI